MSGARRIAALSTEAVETLYLIGAQDRLVGISGFTVHPPEARREKPKVSGYSSAQTERILAVEPDLVIAFSDMQAELCAELVRAGLEVHVFNQRDLAGMLRMVRTVGALAGAAAAADALADRLQRQIEQAAATAVAQRPRVWFEEWHEPLISGIGWVSELVTLAGGEDCFPELAAQPKARDRIIADPATVLARRPDIVLGSWCGRKFQPATVAARPGWSGLPAVRDGWVREIKSPDILSPGPGLLTRGLPQLQALFQAWREARP